MYFKTTSGVLSLRRRPVALGWDSQWRPSIGHGFISDSTYADEERITAMGWGRRGIGVEAGQGAGEAMGGIGGLEEVMRTTVQNDMQIRQKRRNLGNLSTNYLVNYKPL